MKIINRADRLVGDCPVVDPLTFLVGCQQEVVSRVKRKFVFGPVGLSMMSYRLWFTTVKDYLKGVMKGMENGVCQADQPAENAQPTVS